VGPRGWGCRCPCDAHIQGSPLEGSRGLPDIPLTAGCPSPRPAADKTDRREAALWASSPCDDSPCLYNGAHAAAKESSYISSYAIRVSGPLMGEPSP
jgi:hypothetical protein